MKSHTESGTKQSATSSSSPVASIITKDGVRLRLDAAIMRNTTFDEPASATTMYRHLGAHPTVADGVAGVRFAVWAPNANGVSVISDGNGWTPQQDKLHGSDSGIWSGFIAGATVGTAYKYAIESHTGEILQKSDPYAFRTEFRPNTASIIHELRGFEWSDDEWIQARETKNWLQQPVSTYEVHLGSWKRPTDGRTFFNYRELAHQIADYCVDLGYTHLQLLPVTEHPFDGSWGYQTTGYFAPSSRFGTPEDFMYFVDYCHSKNLSVLIDWVPAHFPTDPHGLGNFDGTNLYEHSDPRQGFHPDWNTLIFNYERNEVTSFLMSSARFWADVYHIDGLRVDAVASMLYLDYSRKEGEWIPNKHGGRENLSAIEFLKQFNMMMHGDFPGIMTVAEESTAWPGVSRPVYTGGLGFTMKWDMGWMNDTLRYMSRDTAHRKWHQNDLSFRMVYAFDENFVLPLSHDEVVHGKKSLLSQMPGDHWQQFANLRLLYAYQYALPGKVLQFMGGEIGQWTEWNHDTELDWELLDSKNHGGLMGLTRDLNRVYSSEPALFETDCEQNGFRWIQCDDNANSVYAFIRSSLDGSENIVCVANFTPVPRSEYRVGVPPATSYSEILNTDSELYGGTNVGNQGLAKPGAIASHGFDQSLSITLPPLGMVLLKAEKQPAIETTKKTPTAVVKPGPGYSGNL